MSSFQTTETRSYVLRSGDVMYIDETFRNFVCPITGGVYQKQRENVVFRDVPPEHAAALEQWVTYQRMDWCKPPEFMR